MFYPNISPDTGGIMIQPTMKQKKSEVEGKVRNVGKSTFSM